jgi:hypothetical protein
MLIDNPRPIGCLLFAV